MFFDNENREYNFKTLRKKSILSLSVTHLAECKAVFCLIPFANSKRAFFKCSQYPEA